jgi:hypothetical protein
MEAFIIALSVALTAAAALPYLAQILRGEAKPRLATWFIWSLLAFIAASAAFQAHQLPAAALSLAQAFECEWIVLLGFKKGDRSIDTIDVLCIIGAANCLILLFFLKSPTATIIATSLVDLMGTIPTLRHTWRKPFEEVWSTYLLYVIAEILTLFIVDYSTPAAYIFPIFLLLEDGLLVVIIFLSPNRHRPINNTLPALNWRSGAQTNDGKNIGHINPHLTPRLIVAAVPAAGSVVQPGLAPAVTAPSPMAIPMPAPPTAPAPPAYLPSSPPIAPGIPAIVSPGSVAARVGAPFDFRVVATGNPVPTAINISGTLPAGFDFVNQGDGTAKMSGTAMDGSQGTYPLSFSATSPQGTVSQSFVLTVAA